MTRVDWTANLIKAFLPSFALAAMLIMLVGSIVIPLYSIFLGILLVLNKSFTGKVANPFLTLHLPL